MKGLYASIGGGSPILRYTEAQGRGMVERLDRLSPETAPHQFYVAFRYVRPKSEDALRAMQADGVERAVAFTQYPQFSCSTTGSSLNELWRAAGRTGLRDAFEWSIIDRWPVHDGFIEAMTETVQGRAERVRPRRIATRCCSSSARIRCRSMSSIGATRTLRKWARVCSVSWSGSAPPIATCWPISRTWDRCAGWGRARSR